LTAWGSNDLSSIRRRPCFTESYPLEQIDLPVTFSDKGSFRKETLTFKVVGFPGT
jgi:hypothetical protein